MRLIVRRKAILPSVIKADDVEDLLPNIDAERCGSRSILLVGLPKSEFRLSRARPRPAPTIDAWHRWFYASRDPKQEGLAAIIHPSESGRDNSIDWDKAFERVPTHGVDPYVRRDTSFRRAG